MSLPRTHGSGLHFHFIVKLCLIYAGSQESIQHFCPAPSTWKSQFCFCSKLLVWPQELIKLPFCHLKAGQIFEPWFLPVWQATLPHWFLLLTGFYCVSEALTLTFWEDETLLNQTVHWHLAGSLPWWSKRGHTLVTKEVKNHCLQNPGQFPRNVSGFSNRDTGHQSNAAGSNVLLCWHRLTDSQTWVHRVSPENKGGLSYIPL
jgi:hypothetical protein